MAATARASPSASSASACTVTESAPASRNQGSCSSGFAIMRCTSSGRLVAFFSCLTTGTPIVRFGTKWPSMTSTWTYPAPAFSISSMSRPRCMKSADRMDGAIFTGSNMLVSFLIVVAPILAQGPLPPRRCPERWRKTTYLKVFESNPLKISDGARFVLQ